MLVSVFVEYKTKMTGLDIFCPPILNKAAISVVAVAEGRTRGNEETINEI
jgi:hypothetical protein